MQLCTAKGPVAASWGGERSAEFPRDALRQPPSQPDSRGAVVGIQGPKPGGYPRTEPEDLWWHPFEVCAPRVKQEFP